MGPRREGSTSRPGSSWQRFSVSSWALAADSSSGRGPPFFLPMRWFVNFVAPRSRVVPVGTDLAVKSVIMSTHFILRRLIPSHREIWLSLVIATLVAVLPF